MLVTDEQLDRYLKKWEKLIEGREAISLSLHVTTNLLDSYIGEQGKEKQFFLRPTHYITCNDETIFVTQDQMDRFRQWIRGKECYANGC